MDKFKKIITKRNIIIMLVVLIALVSSITYAYVNSTDKLLGFNQSDTDCFKLTFSGSNDIDLDNAIPLSDEEGQSNTPYEFTIKNVCNHIAQYQVNLETLNTSTLDTNYLKARLSNDDLLYNGNTPFIVSTKDKVTTFVNENVKDSRKFTEGVLHPDDEKTYKLNLWIDENSTVEQSANKKYEGKIVIISTLHRNEYIKVTLDANGGTFKDGSTTYTTYALKNNTYDLVKYSHTPNIDDNGNASGTYASNYNKTDVVTIPGATTLGIEVWFSTDSFKYDWLAIYPAGVVASQGNYSSATISNGKLGGGSLSTKPNDSQTAYHKTYTVNGDTAQFYFHSNASSNYYGYYAIIVGYDENGNRVPSVTPTGFNSTFTEDIVPEPTKDGYIFKEWYNSSTLKTISYNSSLTEDITLKARYVEDATMFKSGTTVNLLMKTLAKGSSVTSESISDTLITAFERSYTLDNDENIASLSGYAYPIYMWYDSGTIKWYTEASKVYLDFNSDYMFKNLKSLVNIDLSDFNTSQMLSMLGMFSGCSSIKNLDLSNFDTSNISSFGTKEYYVTGLTNYYDYSDYSRTGYGESVFEGMSSLESINLSNWNTSNVKSLAGMFWDCSSLTTLDLSSFNTSEVTDMNGMFRKMSSLNNLILGDNFVTTNVTNMAGMFSGVSKLTTLDLGTFNTSNVTNMEGMFKEMRNLTSLSLGNNFDTSKVTDMSGMFFYCNSLSILNLGNNFDTSNVIYMSGMFCSMSNLSEIVLGNLFNTSNVKFMPYMFGNIGLDSLDLSNFDTSNVTNMQGMFSASKLTSLSFGGDFDTSNVTDMSRMFNKLNNIETLDLSGFVTSKVTYMNDMFNEMTQLKNLTLGDSFNTSNVTSMSRMFFNCVNLTNLDLSNFVTSNVTNMSGMFYNVRKVNSLDLSSFDTSNVTKMTYDITYTNGYPTDYYGMFEGCTNLQTIYVGENWNTDSVTESTDLFKYSSNLVGGAGTTYDANHVDKEYARVDDPDNDNPGYLTLKTA